MRNDPLSFHYMLKTKVGSEAECVTLMDWEKVCVVHSFLNMLPRWMDVLRDPNVRN